MIRRPPSLQRIRLLLEALACLLVARLALGMRTYRDFETAIRASDSQSARLNAPCAHVVGSAVSRVAGVAPWRSDCLIQATAARWMLNRRQVPTELTIGVATTASGDVEAHAWLKSGDSFVTGRAGHERFRPIRVL